MKSVVLKHRKERGTQRQAKVRNSEDKVKCYIMYKIKRTVASCCRHICDKISSKRRPKGSNWYQTETQGVVLPRFSLSFEQRFDRRRAFLVKSKSKVTQAKSQVSLRILHLSKSELTRNRNASIENDLP